MKTIRLILVFTTSILLWACGSNTPTEPVPYVAFSWNIDDMTVHFNNQSKNANSYLWDFGDGSTSTLTNPVHAYSKAGTYYVTLQATNIELKRELTKQVIIKSEGITPTPPVETDDYCIIYVTNKTSYQPSIEIGGYSIADVGANESGQMELYERFTTMKQLHPEMDINNVIGKSVPVSAVFYELWEGYGYDTPMVTKYYTFQKGRKYKLIISSTTNLQIELDI